MTVRFHIGILSLVLAIILFFSASTLYSVYKESSVAASKTSSEIFTISTLRVVDRFNIVFERANLIADSLAQLPVMTKVQEHPEAPHAALKTILKVLEQRKWIYSIYFGHSDGFFFQVISVKGNKNVREKHGAPVETTFIIKQIVGDKSHRYTETLFYLDQSQNLIGTSKPSISGYDPRLRPWYLKAINSTRIEMTSPYIFSSLGELGISSAKALEGAKGILAVDFTLSDLKSFLNSQQISPNSQLVLFDETGKPLATSNEENLDKSNTPIFQEVFEFQKTGKYKDTEFIELNDQPYLINIKPIDSHPDKSVFIAAVGPFSDFTQHIDRMRTSILTIDLLILIIVLPLTYFIVRKLADALEKLGNEAEEIQKLQFSETAIIHSPIREVDELASAFSLMKQTIRHRTQSLEETLEALRRHEADLEQKVKERTHELNDALDVINGSIKYASRIQRAMLPETDWLDVSFNDYFVHWEPRDVVGGDIYWCRIWGSGTLIILGDCTGHGVPGAFMTLIAAGALDRAQLDTEPGDIAGLIKSMNLLVKLTLMQHGSEGESDDGMEMGVCYIPDSREKMLFAGARFELFEVFEGQVTITKGTKKGIGYRSIPFEQTYDTHEINLKEGQSFYMTSDGLIDQVGGERRRMFGKKRFSKLLLSLQGTPMKQQKEKIIESFAEFQGEERRRDDLSLIGFRVL